MNFLKGNKCLLFSLVFLLSGCSTSSYRVLFQDHGSTELSVSPDRVLLECEGLSDADIAELYGFMMHVLDDKETVLTVAQGNTLDKSSCEKRLNNIGKILQEGKKIYIAGIGSLKSRPGDSTQIYVFPDIGSFKSNGRSLGFVAISNEKGLCYDAYGGLDEKPCPPEPFPFWNKK